jgi:hypothetical protein
VCIIVGFVFYHSCARYYAFNLAALNSQAEMKQTKHILSELESDNPEKITALKELLRKSIEQGQKNTELWLQAADKTNPFHLLH